MVTKEQFVAQAGRVDVTLTTKDSVEYKFLRENYRVRGDTLLGFGHRKRHLSSDVVLDATLSLADVATVEVMKFDATKTIVVCSVCGVLTVLVYEHFFH